MSKKVLRIYHAFTRGFSSHSDFSMNDLLGRLSTPHIRQKRPQPSAETRSPRRVEVFLVAVKHYVQMQVFVAIIIKFPSQRLWVQIQKAFPKRSLRSCAHRAATRSVSSRVVMIAFLTITIGPSFIPPAGKIPDGLQYKDYNSWKTARAKQLAEANTTILSTCRNVVHEVNAGASFRAFRCHG